MILANPSIWIDFFNRRATARTDRLDGLPGREPVAVGDVILGEALQGFREEAAFERARAAMEALDLVEVGGAEGALEAACNDLRLRARGVTVRKTVDALIATRCILGEIALLHEDRHFEPFREHLGLRSAMAG